MNDEYRGLGEQLFQGLFPRQNPPQHPNSYQEPCPNPGIVSGVFRVNFGQSVEVIVQNLSRKNADVVVKLIRWNTDHNAPCCIQAVRCEDLEDIRPGCVQVATFRHTAQTQIVTGFYEVAVCPEKRSNLRVTVNVGTFNPGHHDILENFNTIPPAIMLPDVLGLCSIQCPRP